MSTIDGRALIVGVSGYQHVRPLPRTQDAEDMAPLLCSPEHGRYPLSQVQTLIEHDATRASILAQFDALADQSAHASVALFYFSGHGGRRADGDLGECYLIPVDADWSSNDALKRTAIFSVELADRLRKIKAQQITIILDCCRAAAVAEVKDGFAPAEARAADPAGFEGRLPRTALGSLVQGGGCVVLAASCSTTPETASSPATFLPPCEARPAASKARSGSSTSSATCKPRSPARWLTSAQSSRPNSKKSAPSRFALTTPPPPPPHPSLLRPAPTAACWPSDAATQSSSADAPTKSATS
jgi:Caspase domain